MHQKPLHTAVLVFSVLVAQGKLPQATADTASPCGDYPSHLRWLGRVATATHGLAFAVAARGDLAFVVGEGSGVDVVDFSDPYAPVVVASVAIPGARRITIDGAYAYVACQAGLRIFDVSDPRNPVPVGFAPLPGATRVTIREQYAYVCAWSAGVQVVDVGDPASPVSVGGLDTPGNAQGITFVGSYACIADGRAGITVADCTDPVAPKLVTTFSAPGYASQVASRGQTVAVADFDHGLLLVDLTVPSQPQVIGQAASPSPALDVAVDAAQLVLADSRGVSVWDWSNPTNPAFTARLDVGYEVHGLAMVGHRVLLPETNFGLHILDVPQPASVQPVVSVNAPVTVWDGAVLDDLLLIAGNPTCHVVRMSGGSPAIVGSLPNSATGVGVTGHLAVFVGDFGLQVVDVSQPSVPALLGRIESLVAHDVECAGRYAYVVGGTALTVVDLAVPADPRIVATLPRVGGRTIRLRDGLAFISGISIVDISNPAAPVLLAQAAIGGRGLALEGNHAYVAGHAAGLVSIDISDVHAPRLESVTPGPGDTFDVAVAAGIAYVASDESGIQVYDLHNPAAPQAMGTIETSGLAFHVGLVAGMLWAGNFDVGLDFIPLQCATTPVAIETFDVSALAGEARIAWRAAAAASAPIAGGTSAHGLEFRLRRDDRDVAFAISGPSDYTAIDPWPAEDPANRSYTLLARRPGEPWLILAERSVQRFAPDPGTVRLAIAPNPSRGACSITFDTGSARATSLAIFTIDGRRVTNLLVPAAAPGSAVLWNGHDSTGRPVPAGLYFVRLQAASKTHTSKLVITH